MHAISVDISLGQIPPIRVLDTLRAEGWEMVRKVMESPKYLEDLTGLTDLMSDADLMAGVIDIADDDTFSVSSCDS